MKLPNTCPKCSGTGTYRWGEGRSGKCNSCAGKGYQTLADARRNYGYNQKNAGTHEPAMSVSLAEGFENDIVLHACTDDIVIKAALKHGNVDHDSNTVIFADHSTYSLPAQEPTQGELDV